MHDGGIMGYGWFQIILCNIKVLRLEPGWFHVQTSCGHKISISCTENKKKGESKLERLSSPPSYSIHYCFTQLLYFRSVPF
jgi:hypothetical protein